MHQLAKFGPNKTGALTARELGKEMLDGLEEFLPENSGVSPDLSIDLIDQASPDCPQGHVPPPIAGTSDDPRLAVLMDKLADRLAFERTGVRLYEGVLAKLDAYRSYEGGPDAADLELIRAQELLHFSTLEKIIRQLGGDPTAITPSANISAVIAGGVCAVVNDPRTTLVQSLEAMMILELADLESFENLIELATAIGENDIADTLEPFATEEETHRDQLRRWLGVASGLEVASH